MYLDMIHFKHVISIDIFTAAASKKRSGKNMKTINRYQPTAKLRWPSASSSSSLSCCPGSARPNRSIQSPAGTHAIIIPGWSWYFQTNTSTHINPQSIRERVSSKGVSLHVLHSLRRSYSSFLLRSVDHGSSECVTQLVTWTILSLQSPCSPSDQEQQPGSMLPCPPHLIFFITHLTLRPRERVV